MGDSNLDRIISAVVAAMVGLILIASAFLPVAASQISSITSIPGIGSIQGGETTVVALLSVVVIMVIVVLLIGVVRYFSSRE